MEETRTAAPPPKKGRRNPLRLIRRNLKTTIMVCLVILVLLLGWAYQNERNKVQRLSNPQIAVQKEAEELKAKVALLVELPNETPTVATVSDVSKLKDQAFFAKAQNGDKVLIFPNAKRAILYRPSTNKVIEYAPVNIGNNQ